MLIPVRKITSGVGPLWLDDKDPRLGTVFERWPESVPDPPKAPDAAPAGNDLRAYDPAAPDPRAKTAPRVSPRPKKKGNDLSAYETPIVK